MNNNRQDGFGREFLAAAVGPARGGLLHTVYEGLWQPSGIPGKYWRINVVEDLDNPGVYVNMLDI